MERSLIKCDGCGKVSNIPTEKLSFFVLIEPDGTTYHFCSSKCLRETIVDAELAWGSSTSSKEWLEAVSA